MDLNKSQRALNPCLRNPVGAFNNPHLAFPDRAFGAGGLTSGSNPSQRSRSFSGEKEPRVGIVVSQYGSPYYGRMLDGAVAWLRENHIQALVQASDASAYGEQRAWRYLLQCDCAGVMLHADRMSDSRLIKMLEQHPQTVLINRRLPGYESQCVYIDNHAGGRMAADFLLQNGHQDIAMITGPTESGPRKFTESSARSKGFLNRLQEAGLKVHPDLIIEGQYQHECGVDALEKLLKSGKRFSAIFAHNDEMAAGALRACRAHGIRVPDDVSIVGFDDQENASVITPKLTSIRQPDAELGARSAEVLWGLLNSTPIKPEMPEQSGRIVPELVIRDSVKNIEGNLGRVHTANELLTTREIECLQWTAAGKTSGTIAILLSISESTVNFHLKNILEKLNASNRTHAVVKALARSLIKPLE